MSQRRIFLYTNLLVYLAIERNSQQITTINHYYKIVKTKCYNPLTSQTLKVVNYKYKTTRTYKHTNTFILNIKKTENSSCIL